MSGPEYRFPIRPRIEPQWLKDDGSDLSMLKAVVEYLGMIHRPGGRGSQQMGWRGAALEIPGPNGPLFFNLEQVRGWVRVMREMEEEHERAVMTQYRRWAAVQGPFGANWVPPGPTIPQTPPYRASGVSMSDAELWKIYRSAEKKRGSFYDELLAHGYQVTPQESFDLLNRATAIRSAVWGGAPEPADEVLELDLSEVSGCTAKPSCGLPDWRCTRCHKDNCPSAEKCWYCAEKA